jgi:ectoine hydroxylase-related dioxygenase (phytanoyl-CoA dioxygenase family)
LPYHQEAGYFTVNVSQKTGVIAWISLFDCDEEAGALRVRIGSHAGGLVEHDVHYEDPVKKRQRRATVPEPVFTRYEPHCQEARRGDVTYQDFFLMHRSGDNRLEDRVRYTVVVRYSDLRADDFRPISWT